MQEADGSGNVRLNERLGADALFDGSQAHLLVPNPEDRILALEDLCKGYHETLEMSLSNVRSLKAASPGVKVYDEWEKELCRVLSCA